MPKIQPSPLKMSFILKGGLSTIDISMAASQIARRFYRQGYNWAVADLELFLYPGQAPSADGLITVQKIQDTWVTSNAWHKGFANWRRMQKEFSDEIPSIEPKYNDFKIYFNIEHYNDVQANIAAGGTGQQSTASALGTLTPIDLTNTYALPGEWVHSKFVVPDVTGATTTDYQIIMHGNNTAAVVGLVKNYQQSRAVPQSPDPETGGATPSNVYSQMFDQGTVQTDAVVADLLADNDELPYDQNDYPGGDTNMDTGQIVLWDGLVANNTTGAIRKLHTGPFNAQCGLIQINNAVEISEGVPAVVYAVLTLVPGDQRGYLTQPMQDV